MYYLLNGTDVVPAENIFAWNSWRAKENRILARTAINSLDEYVSTVFLGIDHNYNNGDHPILFETMVFGGLLDGDMQRYSTWADAMRGHNEMVEKVLDAVEAG